MPLQAQARTGIGPERVLRAQIELERLERAVAGMPRRQDLARALLERGCHEPGPQRMPGIAGGVKPDRLNGALDDPRYRIAAHALPDIDFLMPQAREQRPFFGAALAEPYPQSRDRAGRMAAERYADRAPDPGLVLFFAPHADDESGSGEFDIVEAELYDRRSSERTRKPHQQQSAVPAFIRFGPVDRADHAPQFFDAYGGFLLRLFGAQSLRAGNDSLGRRTQRRFVSGLAVLVHDGAQMPFRGCDLTAASKYVRNVQYYGIRCSGNRLFAVFATPCNIERPIGRISINSSFGVRGARQADALCRERVRTYKRERELRNHAPDCNLAELAGLVILRGQIQANCRLSPFLRGFETSVGAPRRPPRVPP
jgi:hypothetical protein